MGPSHTLLRLLTFTLIGTQLISASCDNTTHFLCKTGGKCIPLEWMCDNVPDCQDSSDEINCSYLHDCPKGTFNCNNGDCIVSRWKCNGEADCHNGFDERACDEGDITHLRGGSIFAAPQPTRVVRVNSPPPPPCPDGFHKCRLGPCIHPSMLCDGAPDCPLEDDEPSSCPAPADCPPNQRMCKDSHTCIPAVWWCDEEADCDDGSDEANCTLAVKSDVWKIPETGKTVTKEEFERFDLTWINCGPESYKCKAAEVCVNRTVTCDGKHDCPEGDDERGMCKECEHMDCSHECRATIDDVRCLCPEGMILGSDHRSCEMDNVCHHHSRCAHFCSPSGAKSYECKCELGYVLHKDGHRCVPQFDPSGGELLISVGNEVRVSALNDHNEHHSAYHVYASIDTGESMYHVAFDVQRQHLFMGIAGHGEFHITEARGGLLRPLRRGFERLAHLEYDWLNNNLYFTAGGISSPPTIHVCTANMRFCKKVYEEKRSTRGGSGQMEYASFGGLAIHPRHGVMCWIERSRQPKIRCSGMDGSMAYTLDEHKMEDPRGLVFDTIRGDLYFADQEKQMIERINVETKERTVIVSSGVHRPYDLEFFNGVVYWSEILGSSVKSVDVSLDSHVVPRLERNFKNKPFGLAVNHSLAQPPLSGMSPCVDADCSHICVTLMYDNTFNAACMCPDEYVLNLNNGECEMPPKNRTTEVSSYLDLTYMSQLCESREACGANGECKEERDEHSGQIVNIYCICESEWTGVACELFVEEPLEQHSDESEGLSIVTVLLLVIAFLIVGSIAFYVAKEKSDTINNITEHSLSAVAENLPKLSTVAKNGVNAARAGLDRVRSGVEPLLPTSMNSSGRGVTTQSFASPMFIADESAGSSGESHPVGGSAVSSPMASVTSSPLTGVLAVFDNFENPSFNGQQPPIEVSYSKKFSGQY